MWLALLPPTAVAAPPAIAREDAGIVVEADRARLVFREADGVAVAFGPGEPAANLQLRGGSFEPRPGCTIPTDRPWAAYASPDGRHAVLAGGMALLLVDVQRCIPTSAAALDGGVQGVTFLGRGDRVAALVRDGTGWRVEARALPSLVPVPWPSWPTDVVDGSEGAAPVLGDVVYDPAEDRVSPLGEARADPAAPTVVDAPEGLRVVARGHVLGVPIPVVADERAVSPDGRIVLTRDGWRVTAWRVADGTALWTAEDTRFFRVKGLRVGAGWAAVLGEPIVVFDLADGHVLATIDGPVATVGEARLPLGRIGRALVGRAPDVPAPRSGEAWDDPWPLLVAAPLVRENACAPGALDLAALDRVPGLGPPLRRRLAETCATHATPEWSALATAADPGASGSGARWTWTAPSRVLRMEAVRDGVFVESAGRFGVLDRTGAVRWTRLARGGSRRAAGDRVLAGGDGVVTAFDARTGAEVWTAPGELPENAGLDERFVAIRGADATDVRDLRTGRRVTVDAERARALGAGNVAFGWRCSGGSCVRDDATAPVGREIREGGRRFAQQDGRWVELDEGGGVLAALGRGKRVTATADTAWLLDGDALRAFTDVPLATRAGARQEAAEDFAPPEAPPALDAGAHGPVASLVLFAGQWLGMDAATGAIRWTAPGSASDVRVGADGVAVHVGSPVFADGPDGVRASDATGAPLWTRADLAGQRLSTSFGWPVAAGRTWSVLDPLTGETRASGGRDLLALSPPGGALVTVVRRADGGVEAGAGPLTVQLPQVPDTVVTAGGVFVARDEEHTGPLQLRRATLRAYGPAGELWRRDVGKGTLLAAGDLVLVGFSDGLVVALDPRTGRVRWATLGTGPLRRAELP